MDCERWGYGKVFGGKKNGDGHGCVGGMEQVWKGRIQNWGYGLSENEENGCLGGVEFCAGCNSENRRCLVRIGWLGF